jgi:hypothetical protein
VTPVPRTTPDEHVVTVGESHEVEMADEGWMREPQTAMPPEWIGAQGGRPPASFGRRSARRGWALLRALVLAGLTGLLIALIVATILGAIIIAINGKLP